MQIAMFVMYKVPAGPKRKTKINTEKHVGRRLLLRFIFVNVYIYINKNIRICPRIARTTRPAAEIRYTDDMFKICGLHSNGTDRKH